ncbi:MAG: winged helix-turn-helix transcriptional regulator [Muribaculaceae bacterium]|nr:winged helix-turn-helix transcriptional regulator [Muribaculaceae bacterium]
MTENNDDSPFLLTETHRKIFNLISLSTRVKYGELQKETGLSRGYLSRVVGDLKEQGYLMRIGSDRKGEWQILKSLLGK